MIELFAEAIAHFEGYYQPGSRAKRNKNPGNLRRWDPKLPVDGDGFQIFPTEMKGWEALRRQIWKNVFVRRLTLLEFFAGKQGVYAGYAPAGDKNDPAAYASFVHRFLGDRGVYMTTRAMQETALAVVAANELQKRIDEMLGEVRRGGRYVAVS